MNEAAGFSTEGEPTTITQRLRQWRNRYNVYITVAIAIIATLFVFAAQIFPSIQDFLRERGFLDYLVLLLVLDLTYAINASHQPPPVRILRDQDHAMPILQKVVPLCREQGVDLIEFAAATTLPLIRSIQRNNVPLRLLVKHPDTVEGVQKQRSIAALDTILTSIYGDRKDKDHKVQVRCYKLPYSLRGRRLGNRLLELSWLTPDPERKTVYGHQNPTVLVDLSVRSNDYLLDFFKRTFETLWNHPTTEDGEAVHARFAKEKDQNAQN